MARSRNIKPGFFTNDVLAEVPALGRILFQGLWCHADREGRLEDRPRKLKAEILPYDACDIDVLIDALAERGFVLRYQVGEARYIQVVNFTKHQNPHVKEPASVIPAPYENQTSPVQAPDENSSGPADSLNLIPDSLTQEGGKPPACPHDSVIHAYHEILPMCPRVKSWNETRQGYLRARWREKPKHQTLEFWQKYFSYVAESKFLTGQAAGRPGMPPFIADLEWLVRPENFAKVLEGKYHREAA